MLATHLGFFNTSSTRTRVRFQFSTHAAAGGNVAPNSAFEAADLRIYKATDGAAFSATQRSSANGITMTSPFDSLTGFHDVDIDLTDNTDAGFYVAGSLYSVVLAPDETVDSQTLTGVVLAYFEIGVAKADVTQFGGTALTAAAGIPEVKVASIANNAIAAAAIASDAITAAKIADGAIDAATFAASAITSTVIAADAITAAKIADGAIDAATFAAGAINAAAIATDAITAGKIAADAIGASELAADAVTEIQSGLATAATLATVAGYLDTEMAATLAAVLNLVGAGYTRTGTAQGGAAGSIDLDAGASAVDDFYNNQLVVIASGTGAGQSRFISDYTGASRRAAVTTWATNPDNTSVFYVVPFGAIAGATAPTAAEIRQEIDNNSTQLAKLGTPAGASISADILVLDNLVDDLESRVGTPSNLGGGATLAANLSDIEAQTDDIGAAGAGLTAVPWNAAWDAEVQSEVADALGVYDPPTNAEMEARTLAAASYATAASQSTIAGYIDTEITALAAQIAALNNLSSAQAQTAAAAALTAYDPPTNAEMEARTLSAALIAKLTAHLGGVLTGVAGSGSTTTSLVLNAATGINAGVPSAVNDFYNDRVIVFLTGALAGQATSISDYVGATVTMTIVGVTSAPQAGDTFIVV